MFNTSEALELINTRIAVLAKDGKKVLVDIDDRAQLRIHNLDPLVFEPFGKLLNRGPHIVGRAAVHGFIEYNPRGSELLHAVAAIQAGGEMYGVVLDGGQMLTEAAAKIGFPQFVFDDVPNR